jgi:hypothetical protein
MIYVTSYDLLRYVISYCRSLKVSVIICKIVLFDFVRRLNYKIIKLQCFGSWILLPSSGRRWVRGQKAHLLGPLVELALDLNIEMPGIKTSDNDN